MNFMPEGRKPKNTVKILLLEDEDVLANLYLKKLEDAGFDVRLYEETDKLLEELGSFNPDIAFLDHALHGENKSGLDVIPALRKQNPKMKIVMLSNYSEFQMEQVARKAGASDYLLKINTPPGILVKHAEKLSA